MRRVLAGAVVVAMVACSSGEPRTILGPNGALVELPPGSNGPATRVAVAVVTEGFPPLPVGAGSTVFALTPHGATFDVPVRVTLPAGPGQVRLLTAQPGGQWEPVPGAQRVGDTVVAAVSHFSYFVPAAADTVRAVIGAGWAVLEVDPSDGGVRTLVEGQQDRSFVTSVAVDDQGRVYWFDNATDALTRLEPDGGGRQVLVTSRDPFSNPRGLALDPARGVLFWCEGSDLLRAALDGTDAGVFLEGASGEFPTSIALDSQAEVLFWTDNGTDSLNRVSYDGGGRAVLRTAGDALANPQGLSLDPDAGFLFWGEGATLLRASLDGGSLTVVVAAEAGRAVVTSTGVDPQARQLYWTDNATDTLSRAGYDGLGVVPLYQGAPASNPQGVALVR